MSSLRQVLNAQPYYFLEDLIQELLGKIQVSNRGTQIRVLAEALERRETLRSLWERLHPEEQAAVRLALYNGGVLDTKVYEALYGELPEKAFSGLTGYRRKPRYLKLFFLSGWELPDEIQAPLREWVEPPPVFKPSSTPDLPEMLQIGQQAVPLQTVETEQALWHDLSAMLRLARERRLKVSEVSGVPASATVRGMQREIMLLDFYSVLDLTRAANTIRPVGLTLLLQASGLAASANGLLIPTSLGLDWLDKPSPQILQTAFQNWQENEDLDELRRINLLKGQTGDLAELTPPAERRKAILNALREYPAGRWIWIEEYFKTIKLCGHAFRVEARQATSLQVQGYGLLDNASEHTYWRAVNGLYILTVLMEYLASFGILDCAFVEPEQAAYSLAGLQGYVQRPLSRYDGLTAVRITRLGAFLLGMQAGYEPAAGEAEGGLLHFAQQDLIQVNDRQTLNPNDRALLERFARQEDIRNFRLDARRTVTAFEQGMKLEDALSFLRLKTGGEVPAEVHEFFKRFRKRSQVLAQKYEAIVYQVKDIELMKQLLKDEKLAELCVLAEDYQILVPRKAEAAFRRRLHELEVGVRS